jgi:hypothetical protein
LNDRVFVSAALDELAGGKGTALADREALSRDFRSRSIFDFFDSIGHFRKSGGRKRKLRFAPKTDIMSWTG